LRPCRAGFESGAQSADACGSKVWIGSQTTIATTTKKAISPPSPATSGVISIRSCGCRAQPRGTGGVPEWRPSSSNYEASTGGAIALATLSVSRRRRSIVFVQIVMPMFTIWTIPEMTIIAPKIPRAM
jgi:hypothetical protein